MPLVFYNLLAALIMLALGLAGMAVLSRILYPALRERHGRALAHGGKAMPPRLVMRLLWLTALLVLPIAGFHFGGPLLAALAGQ